MRLMKKSEQSNTFEVTHKQLLLTNVERNKGIEPSPPVCGALYKFCTYNSSQEAFCLKLIKRRQEY